MYHVQWACYITIVLCLWLAIKGSRRVIASWWMELRVTIMPKSTMTNLGITTEELSKSRMMIRRFKLEGQCFELTMRDLSTSLICHAISNKTS